MPFRWQCPFCNHFAVVELAARSTMEISSGNRHGVRRLISTAIVCPNPDCREIEINTSLSETRIVDGIPGRQTDEPFRKWTLQPEGAARPLPEYVPQAIANDYREASLIKDLSPKASATLARRCLQGMLRDFWNARGRTLFDEIESIKDRLEPQVVEAIDAVRGVGNIGAHMERDIDVIVDVEPNEAELLLALIENLVDEWYVARHGREERLAKVRDLGKSKQDAREPKAQ